MNFSNKAGKRRQDRNPTTTGHTAGYVASYDARTDKVHVEGSHDAAPYPAPHPYCAPNSWARIAPEPGAQAVMDARGDGNWIEPVGYTSRQGANRVERYNTEDSLSLYGPLQPGSQELMSSGQSYLRLDANRSAELGAGLVSVRCNDTTLTATATAARHERQLHLVSRGDGESFGAVVRNGRPLMADTVARKEWHVRLASTGPAPALYEHTVGDVFDDDGQPLTGEQGTGLRAGYTWWSENNEPTRAQVGLDGGVSLRTARGGAGLAINIVTGDIEVVAGEGSISMGAGRDFTADARGFMELTASGPVILDGAAIRLGAGQAVHPVPKGTPLVGTVLPGIITTLQNIAISLARVDPFGAAAIMAQATALLTTLPSILSSKTYTA